jgi:alpha-1,3-rhamnosyltransferase
MSLILEMDIGKIIKYHWNLCAGKEFPFASSLEEIKRNFPKNVEILEATKIRRAFSEYSASATPAELQYADEEYSYKAIFRDVACFANSDVILFKNKKIFSEVKTYKMFRNKASCEDGYILMDDKPSWHRTEIPHTTENVEKGIFLTGTYSWNYYHFFYVVMARILKTYDIPTDVPLLVDESCGFISTYKQILDICNKQHRKIIYLKNNVRYNVHELFYISSPLIIVPNSMQNVVYTPDFAQYDVDVIRAFRKELLPFKDQSRSYPKRIFISRKNASSRRKFNENECIMLLKQYGFEVVYPETMSFMEQVALFSSAETIVAGSGAAFTNLLFCSKGCNIIIIIGYHYHLSFWQTLSCINELNLYEINDPSKGFLTKKNKPYDIHNDFVIDVNDLKKLIEKIGYEQTYKLPNVTVSVLTYNSGKYVRETLESIKNQTYPNIILQICDDCSNDDTLAICKGWIEMYGSRFVKTKIIQPEKNTGVSANCNRAWDNCETEYCKEIAGDDILLPNCIADNMAYAMENPDAKMIFSQMDVIPCDKNADDGTKKRYKEYVKSIEYSFFNLREEERKEILKTENHLLAPTLFTKVKDVKELGLRHDERIPDVEDYPKWINASNLGIKFHFIAIPTVSYRFHNNSTSNASSQSWRYKHNLQLIKKYYSCKDEISESEAPQSLSSEDKQKLEDMTKDLVRVSRKNSKHLRMIRELIGLSALLALSLLISLFM